MTETTAPVQSLHDQIMRLPCDPAEYTNVNMMLAYKSGHRDARHAAAELAAAYEADAQQAAPVAVPDGWKLVPVEPTQEMATAYRYGTLLQNRNAWRAMLSAAPTPPEGPWESPCTPPAQQSQWVPSRKQLPPLDIPVWLSDEGRGVFIGMRSSSTDGWLWAECDAYRFFGGQWESIEAHFDDFEPSCWMPLPAAPGDAAPLAESGAQVDELAQLVAKLVQALRKASPDAPLAAKAVDYLRRKRLLNPLRDQARGDTAAPEQAEQPHPVNRSVIRDVFLRNGFTIKEGHSDLKPYVYAAAEELLALDGKAVAVEQDTVTVPRELLERVAATLEDCAVAWDEAVGDGRTLDQMRKDDDITLALPGELRALLGGGE